MGAEVATLTLMAATTAASVGAGIYGSVVARQDAKANAELEKLRAKDLELQRQQQHRLAMDQFTATAAMFGLSPRSPSVLALGLDSARMMEADVSAARLMGATRAASLRSEASREAMRAYGTAFRDVGSLFDKGISVFWP